MSNTERFPEPEAPWKLAGGVTHRNQIAKKPSPGRGGRIPNARAGADLVSCGTGGWRDRLISAGPVGPKPPAFT